MKGHEFQEHFININKINKFIKFFPNSTIIIFWSTLTPPGRPLEPLTLTSIAFTYALWTQEKSIDLIKLIGLTGKNFSDPLLILWCFWNWLSFCCSCGEAFVCVCVWALGGEEGEGGSSSFLFVCAEAFRPNFRRRLDPKTPHLHWVFYSLGTSWAHPWAFTFGLIRELQSFRSFFRCNAMQRCSAHCCAPPLWNRCISPHPWLCTPMCMLYFGRTYLPLSFPKTHGA